MISDEKILANAVEKIHRYSSTLIWMCGKIHHCCLLPHIFVDWVEEYWIKSQKSRFCSGISLVSSAMSLYSNLE